MNTIDYISPIREQLEEELEYYCMMFKLIGTRKETPRWFNFGGFDVETKRLFIKSTQTDLGFYVSTPFDKVESREFWQQFKRFRTDYLIKHHPTIDPY